MDDFPTANSDGELAEIISESEYGPDDFTREMAERVLDVATERTRTRLDGPMDEGKDYVFVSNWQNMTEDKLGRHDGHINMLAVGRIDFDTSDGKEAYLVKDAAVPQWKWLLEGDGRMNDVVDVDLSDGDYHDDPKEMWWPRDYAIVVEIADSIVKGQATVADAM